MKNYFRYSAELLVYFPVAYLGFLLGGPASLLAIAFMVASQVLIDNLSAADLYNPQVRYPILLDALLVAHLPIGLIAIVLMAWAVTPGDLGGIGNALHQRLPFIPETHASPGVLGVLSVGLLAGFILSGNTVVAHELVHRRSSAFRMGLGRLILSINADSQFEIAHVYGHHVNVATAADPASARRGESLYRFFVRSTLGQYGESMRLERARLDRNGCSFWSLRNRLLSGSLLTGATAAAVAIGAGWRGIAAYAVGVVYAKFLLENVNYIQHYGLVRVPGAKVEPRHSWDCMGAACTAAFYALPRHSHHHARPVNPFWDLHVTAGGSGLHLKWGYLGAMMLAMVPPLWFRVTTPLLLAWDARCASPEELRLIDGANRASGLPALAGTVPARA